jgi:hypothetical protein
MIAASTPCSGLHDIGLMSTVQLGSPWRRNQDRGRKRDPAGKTGMSALREAPHRRVWPTWAHSRHRRTSALRRTPDVRFWRINVRAPAKARPSLVRRLTEYPCGDRLTQY